MHSWPTLLFLNFLDICRLHHSSVSFLNCLKPPKKFPVCSLKKNLCVTEPMPFRLLCCSRANCVWWVCLDCLLSALFFCYLLVKLHFSAVPCLDRAHAECREPGWHFLNWDRKVGVCCPGGGSGARGWGWPVVGLLSLGSRPVWDEDPSSAAAAKSGRRARACRSGCVHPFRNFWCVAVNFIL